MKDELKRISNQLVSIEDKLDNHLARLSTAENDIGWLKGSAKIGITLFMAIITSLVGWFFKTLK